MNKCCEINFSTEETTANFIIDEQTINFGINNQLSASIVDFSTKENITNFNIDEQDLNFGLDSQYISGGGTGDYEALINRPKINGYTVTGNKTGEEYKLQDLMDDISEQEIDMIVYGG